MSTQRIPDLIRRFSVLIALFWLALAVVTNVFVPQLETDSSAMIVLEGDQPLGAEAHHYYDGLIDKLSKDTKHVEHIQNFWGDPLTAAGSQSADGYQGLRHRARAPGHRSVRGAPPRQAEKPTADNRGDSGEPAVAPPPRYK